MFKEHERIVLISDILEEGLVAGDIGTIVHIHPEGRSLCGGVHGARREYGCDCNSAAIAGPSSNRPRYYPRSQNDDDRLIAIGAAFVTAPYYASSAMSPDSGRLRPIEQRQIPNVGRY